MAEIKPVKITAEITLTKEDFLDWCEEDVNPSDGMFKHFVEMILWNKLGINENYDKLINNTVEARGLQITLKNV